jgi:hypothetical protein
MYCGGRGGEGREAPESIFIKVKEDLIKKYALGQDVGFREASDQF